MLRLCKPDSEFLLDHAARVEEYEQQGRRVRTTITICVVDDEVLVDAHSIDRLTSLLGALTIAGQILQDQSQYWTEESGAS